MTYCFRIRCTLATTVSLSASDERWTLATSEAGGEDVFLASAEGNTIDQARELVVRGSAFSTEESAKAAGQRWLNRVKRAFSKLHVGADFGETGTPGAFFKAGLEMIGEQYGSRALNDTLGLSVFECEPAPIFAGAGSVTVSSVKLGALETLRATAAGELEMSPQEEIAYSLYSASFNEKHADARFIMLMMAIETLLPEVERPTVVLRHVEHLAELTRHANLPDNERRSLLGSLRWLRLQSVNQAGRKLAASLGDRTYMDASPSGAENAAKFFTRCYEMRSSLVHGHVPRPTRQDVSIRANYLEWFVGDLLAGDLLSVDAT